MNEDGEPAGQWRIRREEVGSRKERARARDPKRQPKRTQKRLFKYLYTYVETLRLGYGVCDITSEISNSTETK